MADSCEEWAARGATSAGRTVGCLVFVRGLYIATGQYSSFCGCALGLVLGGFDHMEDDDQDRGDEEIGQDVEALEREVKARRDNAQSDTW